MHTNYSHCVYLRAFAHMHACVYVYILMLWLYTCTQMRLYLILQNYYEMNKLPLTYGFVTNREINSDIRFASICDAAWFHRVQIALQIGLVIITVYKLFMT